MGYELAVVNLLESPTRQAVEDLSVSCAITNAAKGFFSGDQVKLAEQVGDQVWLEKVDKEIIRRNQELWDLFGERRVSRQVAKEIDDWAAAQVWALADSGRIEKAIAAVSACEAVLKEVHSQLEDLHGQNRFGWDYSQDREDTEYTSLSTEKQVAIDQLQGARLEVRLAKAGILQSK